MKVPVVIGGITRWKEVPDAEVQNQKPARKPLLREAFGSVIREHRMDTGRTLRQVSRKAGMALGYLSEVERGQKEASSEVIASLCKALDLPLVTLLVRVASMMQEYEKSSFPDTIPVEMVNDILVGTKN
jgi:ribosome-binding protein aMBF1 (putative translation factor)